MEEFRVVASLRVFLWVFGFVLFGFGRVGVLGGWVGVLAFGLSLGFGFLPLALPPAAFITASAQLSKRPC